MNYKHHKYILYVIILVIIATIGIQAYWNYKNYLTHKQQLINEVQISLDKSVDDYYSSLAKKTTIKYAYNNMSFNTSLKNKKLLEKALLSINKKRGKIASINSFDISKIKEAKVHKELTIDSLKTTNDSLISDSVKSKILTENKKYGELTSKILISITNDTLNLKTIDTILNKELKRKNITIDYRLNFKKRDSVNVFGNQIIIAEADSIPFKHKDALSTISESTFLPKEGNLSIYFTNETKVILARMLGGISISILLVIAIISSLFYLLKIINNQKQLAEVKNDLISNITHEFKTPIATIGAALEGINNFNIIDDKEKTKKYLNISSGQLSKLNLMVEKLLETATLDSESLNLNKEDVDVVSLLNILCSRYQIQNETKKIETNFNVENQIINVDVFHFENAINNILDNAVKYGGKLINVDLFTNKTTITINISDNGISLNKINKERIFEKFYRIPKGNQHDIKGFGIGLYYTKSIIEKHGGTISLGLKNNLTTFKIEIPNG